MKKLLFPLCFLILVCLMAPFHLQAGPSSAQLSQYISDLQNSSDDQTLREKIIKLVRSMKHKPATPDDFDKFMDRGTEAFKDAKNVNDFNDAIKEFKKATLAAPWIGNAYYNLGLAREKAGNYMGAVESLKLYLLASPHGSDAKKVKSMINKIEYEGEKAEKNRIHSFNGVWARFVTWGTGDCSSTAPNAWKLEISEGTNGAATIKWFKSGEQYDGSTLAQLSSNQLSYSVTTTGPPGCIENLIYTLSDDGQSINCLDHMIWDSNGGWKYDGTWTLPRCK